MASQHFSTDNTMHRITFRNDFSDPSRAMTEIHVIAAVLSGDIRT